MTSADRGPVTIGVDVGTTSVKALAVDAAGVVVARARVPHSVIAPTPNVLEHDARTAWHDGVLAAAAQVASEAVSAGHRVVAVDTAAMVPSLCPVDDDGTPIGPGLLYGDERAAGAERGLDPSEDGEAVRMLRWLVEHHPGAAGYWPAQAVAASALTGGGTGSGAIDTVTAMTTCPLFDHVGWDDTVVASVGATPAQLPRILRGDEPAGRCPEGLGPDLAGAVVGPGTIDAFGEQLVAGADRDGDVLVILGATLIVWACVPNWVEAPGLWTVPHTAPGKVLVGGPSNAGGLLRDWALRTLVTPPEGDDGTAGLDPFDVPVVLPYLRGERTPLHDPDRRAEIHGVSLAHGPAAMWRAVREASGHSVRHHLELAHLLGPGAGPDTEAGTSARRIVATGGGIRDLAWVQAIADVTGLPVDCVAVPEGAALGAAWLARVAAGLAVDASGAAGWSSTGRRIEPDPEWHRGATQRYAEFVERTGEPYVGPRP
jgi:xylulokinase